MTSNEVIYRAVHSRSPAFGAAQAAEKVRWSALLCAGQSPAAKW